MTTMNRMREVTMSLNDCLYEAKSRLIMVAFLNFSDPNIDDMVEILEKITTENRRIMVLAVDVTKNLQLAREYNVSVCPTFMFFRNRCLLGSKVTTREGKLRESVEKFNKIFVALPSNGYAK